MITGRKVHTFGVAGLRISSRATVRLLAMIAIVLQVAACAATYRPPSLQPNTFIRTVDSSRAELFAATKRGLVLAGYEIQTSDEGAGIVATAPRQLRLTPEECDCGTTMGIPYIKDNRTIIHVKVGAVLGDRTLTLTPSIDGQYLQGISVDQGINFNCVSTGRLEEGLFDQIAEQLRNEARLLSSAELRSLRSHFRVEQGSQPHRQVG